MHKPVGTRETDLVSEALRQLWASAEQDPVPAEFMDLLDRLDNARASDSGAAPSTGKPAKGSAKGADTAS